jgi:hemoglobin-like flavoprotein
MKLKLRQTIQSKESTNGFTMKWRKKMDKESMLDLIRSEIDFKIEEFLVREEKELLALFNRMKEEEAEKNKILMEGIKSHTSRIVNLENKLKDRI